MRLLICSLFLVVLCHVDRVSIFPFLLVSLGRLELTTAEDGGYLGVLTLLLGENFFLENDLLIVVNDVFVFVN